jgi:serine/threonine-protein kinase RsbW
MDEWTVDLPGSPCIVPFARRWVGEILRDRAGIGAEVVEDMQLIASELTTNCVRHSLAAEGGEVRLRIRLQGDALRLEVEDGGALTGPEVCWTGKDAADFGRGLAIIAQIADEMGDETTPAGGRLAWAEMKP